MRPKQIFFVTGDSEDFWEGSKAKCLTRNGAHSYPCSFNLFSIFLMIPIPFVCAMVAIA